MRKIVLSLWLLLCHIVLLEVKLDKMLSAGYHFVNFYDSLAPNHGYNVNCMLLTSFQISTSWPLIATPVANKPHDVHQVWLCSL